MKYRLRAMVRHEHSHKPSVQLFKSYKWTLMNAIEKETFVQDFTTKVRSTRIRKAGGKYSDIYICETIDGIYVAVKQFRFASDEDARTFSEASPEP